MALVDVHVHFMPQNVLDKVWAYFDRVREAGVDWTIRYRTDENARLTALRELGVSAFAPLVYPHKPGMAQWLNDWAADFAARVPEAVPTGTFYAEPGAEAYVRKALEAGARCFKSHVQVGAYDPRDPLLDGVWGQLAEAGVPAVVHCGDGPYPGEHTGLGVFEEVLKRHPRLTAVLAHAGMPDYSGALDLVERYRNVHVDTTMVGVPFSEDMAPLPADWRARVAGLADRVVLGSDFPNIPYPYEVQIDAIRSWGLDAAALQMVLHDNGTRLLQLSR
ncbi:amidohydrolase family protein [Lentzea sp. NBRC 102530]|uniref:amidohydrolase family protein n=1 Tax=Lentzea sp. NBRC 102530 TaxID=3032201 RepID=UPI0024A44F7B|nr:amidohydrolase family protein [Lentzea sp. NBRC 102530]GLY48649.1 hydrolase [Lentzea sp. NBRC 102530]